MYLYHVLKYLIIYYDSVIFQFFLSTWDIMTINVYLCFEDLIENQKADRHKRLIEIHIKHNDIMKKLFLIFPSILFLLFSSCNDDDCKTCGEKEPEQPVEFALQISLPNYTKEVTDTETGEVVYKTSCNVEDIVDVLFVVHLKEMEGVVNQDEKFIFYKRLQKGDFKQVEDFLLLDEQKLPLGSYYFTLIASTEPFTNFSSLSKVSEQYSKAALQIPFADVYYKTFEVRLDDNTKAVVEEVELDRLTSGHIIFSIVDWNKVPKDAKIEVTGEIKDLPTAFYLKTGETLTSEEHEKYSFDKHNGIFRLNRIQDKRLFVSYPLLRNSKLDNTAKERGVFLFSFNQNNELMKTENIVTPEVSNSTLYTAVHSLYLYE